MLGCHDGIPVLDLKGKLVNGVYNKGLLEDSEIEGIMSTIMERGGRVKIFMIHLGTRFLLSSQRNIF
jgi:sucrose phosphorylase